jgi:pyruvate dehydrogenase E1 component beta subunit
LEKYATFSAAATRNHQVLMRFAMTTETMPDRPAGFAGHEINRPLTAPDKVGFLRDLFRIRRFEQAALQYYQAGRMGGFLHLYIGQESVAVGTLSLRKEDDQVIAGYRTHAHALLMGLSMNECMAELFGKATGCSKGKGGSMHFFAPEKNYWGGHGIVAGQTPLGLGLGYALKYKGLKGCCLCYLGEVTEGLWKRFGDKRVVDTPISEAAFVGLGIGASMMGLRPVIELMFWSFAFVAYDQIVNNAGCLRYMSGGSVHVPIVIRGPANAGTNVGATHSHAPESGLANFPGVKVICPATAYDAKGLLKTAIRDNDPVFVMENTLLYGEEWDVPEEEFLVPLGVADVKREGKDVSLIAHGRAVITSLKAAEVLASEHGIHAEVVDLRSIRPLDEETILRSVAKTHRAVLVDENKPFCGVSAQIASTIQEKVFDELDAPVLRVCSMDAPAIYSPPLEKLQLPTPERVVQKVLSIA